VSLEKACKEEDSSKISQHSVEVLKELDQFQFQMDKEQFISDAYQRDCKHYESVFVQREREIAVVKQEIEDLKVQLKNEQQGKRNKEEYLALARLIKQHPSRATTEAAINSVKEELASVEARSREINSELDARSKQFQLFFLSLSMLQSDLESEVAPSQKKEKEKNQQMKMGTLLKNKNPLLMKKKRS